MKAAAEKDLFPRKLEMAMDIFHWAEEIIATEEWRHFEKLGIRWGSKR